MLERINLLKAMHTVICSLNDEDAYYTWIYIMPDEPSDSDFESIAEDNELMNDCVKTFFKIILQFDAEVYIDGKLFGK